MLESMNESEKKILELKIMIRERREILKMINKGELLFSGNGYGMIINELSSWQMELARIENAYWQEIHKQILEN